MCFNPMETLQETKTFYPNIKAHISPSALDAWHNNRGLFIRSYFIGEKSPETAAMKAGRMIHALIEGGLLEVKHTYDFVEDTIEVNVDDNKKVLGIPDSYGFDLYYDTAMFVDYKSGKENHWDGVKLAGDLKMKTTAWLIWNVTSRPKRVKAFIEYIPTQWNPETREVEPTGGESVVAAEIVYEAKDLEAFSEVISKTMDEINEAYQEWLGSTDDYINQDDVTLYAELNAQKIELETKMEVIKDRISDQMNMGNKDSLSTPLGSFYFTSRKSWEYPKELEEAEVELKAKKKKFETENQPTKITKAFGFRAKK